MGCEGEWALSTGMQAVVATCPSVHSLLPLARPVLLGCSGWLRTQLVWGQEVALGTWDHENPKGRPSHQRVLGRRI